MKQVQVQNVKVDASKHGYKWSASCECDGARYHFWFNPYFPTRHLDARAAAAIVKAMWAAIDADGLIEKASQAKADEERREEEAKQAEIPAERVRGAAPDLLAALKALLIQALQSDVASPANEWGREALAMATAAVAKAEAQETVE